MADREPTITPGRIDFYDVTVPDKRGKREKLGQADWSHESVAQLRKKLEGKILNEGEGEAAEEYRKIISAAKEFHLRRLIEAAGRVEKATGKEFRINKDKINDFEVWVVPKSEDEIVASEADRFGTRYGQDGVGEWISEYKLALIYAGGDKPALEDADAIAHELSHGMVLNYMTSIKTENDLKNVGDGSGWWRETRNGVFRGVLLEEASAVDSAINFLRSGEFYEANPEMATEFGSKKVRNFLIKTYGEGGEYYLFWQILEEVVKRIKAKEGEDSIIEDLILLGRYEPKVWGLIRDKCDKEFGRGVFREIWKLGEKKNQTSVLRNMLDKIKYGEVYEYLDNISGLEMASMASFAVELGRLATSMASVKKAGDVSKLHQGWWISKNTGQVRLRVKGVLYLIDLHNGSDVFAEGENMIWLVKNFYWQLLNDYVDRDEYYDSLLAWNSLEPEYSGESDGERIMDRLLIRISRGNLVETKKKLLGKLGKLGGDKSASERYALLGRIFDEAGYAIGELRKNRNPNTDWINNIDSLVERLKEAVG